MHFVQRNVMVGLMTARPADRCERNMSQNGGCMLDGLQWNRRTTTRFSVNSTRSSGSSL